MSTLNILMLESLLIIITIAFVMTRIGYVRKIITQNNVALTTQLSVILIFGLFGIIGTYTGITFNTISGEAVRWKFDIADSEAIVNFRVLGVVTAGLLGGFRVGLGAGLIAGIHRYFLGGFSATACAISTIFAGFFAGLISKRLPHKQRLNPYIGAGVAVAAESIQMIIILGLAQPIDQVFSFSGSKTSAEILVGEIAFPMIVLNGLGCGLFILIVRNILREEEHIGALQAKSALRLASLTLKHMRRGLDINAAMETCKILYHEIKPLAVAITDQVHVLAYISNSPSQHVKHGRIKTAATRKVINTGELLVIRENKELEIDNSSRAAIIAPLKCNNKTVGTLKFYYIDEREMNSVSIELVSGLAEILSMQLNSAEGERQRQLAKEVGIRAVLSEDVIHFIGNTLTTLNSLIRTDKLKARQLVNWISRYVKKGLDGSSHKWTTIGEELDHIMNYLDIYQITYARKLHVEYHIDDCLRNFKIPPLILMTLVDNAIKYGSKDMGGKESIKIELKKRFDMICIKISDSGRGISEDKMELLGKQRVNSKQGTGLGIYNAKHLLVMMYGAEASMDFKSEAGKGTEVTITIPKQEQEVVRNGTTKIAHNR